MNAYCVLPEEVINSNSCPDIDCKSSFSFEKYIVHSLVYETLRPVIKVTVWEPGGFLCNKYIMGLEHVAK